MMNLSLDMKVNTRTVVLINTVDILQINLYILDFFDLYLFILKL